MKGKGEYVPKGQIRSIIFPSDYSYDVEENKTDQVLQSRYKKIYVFI